MTGQPPDASELKTWKVLRLLALLVQKVQILTLLLLLQSNHFYTVLAYDRAQQNLLPLNSELLSHKLKKIIKRCHLRSSTGRDCVLLLIVSGFLPRWDDFVRGHLQPFSHLA